MTPVATSAKNLPNAGQVIMEITFRRPCLVILGTVLALFLANEGQALAQDSYMKIGIKMQKKVFAVGEPILGKVIIESHIPATYPATFSVKVYKNDGLVYQSYTKTPIFWGTTEYELKNFGIWGISNKGPDVRGHWRIAIAVTGNPSVFCEGEFVIGPSGKEAKGY